jgi:hypothetical protein
LKIVTFSGPQEAPLFGTLTETLAVAEGRTLTQPGYAPGQVSSVAGTRSGQPFPNQLYAGFYKEPDSRLNDCSG